MIPLWPQVLSRVLTGTALVIGGSLCCLAVLVAPGAVWSGLVLGAVAGGCAGRRICSIAPGDTASRRRSGRRGALVFGTTVAVGSMVLLGVVLLAGPLLAAVLLLCVAVAVSVWWWRRPDDDAENRTPWAAVWNSLRRIAHDHPDRDTPRHPQRPSTAGPAGSRPALRTTTSGPPRSAVPEWSRRAPGDLSTAQLCLAWRCTYFALSDLPAGAPRAELVRLRAALLDEIEHRDPDGFTCWLATGARAGSDPGRYLAG